MIFDTGRFFSTGRLPWILNTTKGIMSDGTHLRVQRLMLRKQFSIRKPAGLSGMVNDMAADDNRHPTALLKKASNGKPVEK